NLGLSAVISWHRMDRLCLLLATWALPLLGTGQADHLCAVLKGKQSPAQLIAVRAVLHPTMHGTYLAQHGCESSLLLVLPLTHHSLRLRFVALSKPRRAGAGLATIAITDCDSC